MSALILKVVASLTMLLDHIGYCFWNRFPADEEFRIIGRIAFPLFAYMIASGYRRSRRPAVYLARLAAFAVITEPFYNYCFYGHWVHSGGINVLFTLGIGLLALMAGDLIRKKYTKDRFGLLPLATAILFALAAEKLGTDYGMYGVILIFLFDLAERTFGSAEEVRGDPKRSAARAAVIAAVCAAFGARFLLVYLPPALIAGLTGGAAPKLPGSWEMTQMWSALSALFIIPYSGKRGVTINNRFLRAVYQYSFYAFYPVHLLVLGLICR